MERDAARGGVYRKHRALGDRHGEGGEPLK